MNLPLLLVGLLPIFALGFRSGLFGKPWVLRLAVALAVLGIGVSLPYGGVDLREIKVVNFFLASAAALFLFLRPLGLPFLVGRWRQGIWLGLLTALGLVNYLNYFSFHGERTFVHLHDVAHYYLGSKYFEELGYGDLYTAMVRAESELFNQHFLATEARDLETYERVHVRRLLARSEPIRQRFTQARWRDFKRDVEWFRAELGPLYGTVLLDHGFNPTPVWALMGGSLSRWVPAGSSRGILVLALLDSLLLLAMFGLVLRHCGGSTALLAALYFFVLFGATFGWVGGAFLRFPWLLCVVWGFLDLRRQRHARAGSLFAIAAALRVFPVLFVVPLLWKAVALWRRKGRIPRRLQRFFAGLLGTGLFLFVASVIFLPRGLDHWRDFHANMENHLANISPNVVGLTEVLAFQPDLGWVTAEELEDLKNRRQSIYRWQMALVFAPLLLLVAWRVGGLRDSDTVLLALPLLFAGLSLAAYYYVFLLLLLLARHRQSWNLALLFAVEAACYALLLFEERESRLFLYRDLLLVFLFVILLYRPQRASGVGLDRRPATA